MEVEWWCAGKTPYLTKAEAMKRIRKQWHDRHRGKSKHRNGDIMRPYKCRTCGHWHVGGTNKDSIKRCDKNGNIVRFDMDRPKGFDRYGRPKGSKQSREASLSSMHPDAEEQAGQVIERQPSP